MGHQPGGIGKCCSERGDTESRRRQCNARQGEARQKQKTKERTVTTSANSIRDAAGFAPEEVVVGGGREGMEKNEDEVRMRKWKWKGERERATRVRKRAEGGH